MFVAKVIDGQIADTGDLHKMFNNTSFPASGPSDEWLTENNIRVIKSWKDHDTNAQKLESVAPYIDGDEVFSVQVVQLSQEEIDQRTTAKAASVRATRNSLLAASDWTQLADSTADKEAWAAYRQELRDISSQAGFPWSVVFPLRPGEVAFVGP